MHGSTFYMVFLYCDYAQQNMKYTVNATIPIKSMDVSNTYFLTPLAIGRVKNLIYTNIPGLSHEVYQYHRVYPCDVYYRTRPATHLRPQLLMVNYFNYSKLLKTHY